MAVVAATKHSTTPNYTMTNPPWSNQSDSDDSEDNTGHHDISNSVELPQPEDMEPWADWIKRSTHEAEARMRALHLDDWVTVHQRRKQAWAEQLPTTGTNKWTLSTFNWDPSKDPRLNAQRRQGRPKARWADEGTRRP